MTSIGKNVILGLIFSVIFFLVITTKTSQMVLTILFTIFVLDMSEGLVQKYISNELKYKKLLSMVFSILTITIIITILIKAFSFMINDLNELINNSQEIIIAEINKLGLFNAKTIEEIYGYLLNLVKENVGVVTTGVGLIIKVVLGIILGVIFHFSTIETQKNSTLETKIIEDLKYYFEFFYQSFKNIMTIQLLIAFMNTTIVALMALGLTYIWSGNFLPYWYVIVPITFILSLIPVVGNVLINIILMMSTIQISITYVGVGIGMFLIIHKLELLVIGNKMKEKMNLPFIFILISMILGEFLFHSMSGMILGMVLVSTLSMIMKKIEFKKD